MNNLLVIGGLGFIGSHTTRALIDAGARCVVTRHQRAEVAPFLTSVVASGAIAIEPADVGDVSSLRSIGEKHAIDAIVHLAGDVGPPLEVVKNSALGLANVLECAVAWKVKRVVVASTLGVYAASAAPAAGAWREDALLTLSAPHAIPAQKKWMEGIALYAGPALGLDVVVARIAGIYGPLYRGMGSVPSLLVHAAVTNRAPDLSKARFGSAADDGYDHCYVKDCARGLALLATSTTLSQRVYNVGSGRASTNARIADVVARVSSTSRASLPDGGGPAFSLSIERLAADTGYAPRFTLDDGIADYFAWLRAGHEA